MDEIQDLLLKNHKYENTWKTGLKNETYNVTASEGIGQLWR